MSGDFNFSSVGLGPFGSFGMAPPVARLERATDQKVSLATPHGTTGIEAGAPADHNLHLGSDLQVLCKGLNDAAQVRQARKETFTASFIKPYSHPNLTKTLMNHGKSSDVKRSSPHKLDLQNSFATVHKPVIFLDSAGFAEYVFVHVDGKWRGYDGVFRPLADTLSPVDAMMNISGRSNIGMCFTQYDVMGDFRVIEAQATRPEDAHAEDDGTRPGPRLETHERQLPQATVAPETVSDGALQVDLEHLSAVRSRSVGRLPTDGSSRRSTLDALSNQVPSLSLPARPLKEPHHE